MTMAWKVYWEPAVPHNKSNKTKTNIRHQTFLPTYEREEPQMCLILSWHYGRQWLEERQDHEKTMKKATKKATKFIPPDINKWLEKRKPTKTRRERCKCCLH